MPSIRFWAPLLAFLDLVTVTAMTLRQRRTRQASYQDGEGPAYSCPAMHLSAEEAHDARPRRSTYRNVPRPLP